MLTVQASFTQLAHKASLAVLAPRPQLQNGPSNPPITLLSLQVSVIQLVLPALVSILAPQASITKWALQASITKLQLLCKPPRSQWPSKPQLLHWPSRPPDPSTLNCFAIHLCLNCYSTPPSLNYSSGPPDFNRYARSPDLNYWTLPALIVTLALKSLSALAIKASPAMLSLLLAPVLSLEHLSATNVSSTMPAIHFLMLYPIFSLLL